jgi:two-component system NtrC family sensor kinase
MRKGTAETGQRRSVARTSKVRLTIQEMLHRARIAASEAQAHQVATAEILNIIARSPEDEQPVFDAIAENARRLIGGFDAAVYRVVDGMLHLAAFTEANPTGDAALRSLYPAPVGTTNAGKAVLMRAPSYRADVEEDPEVHPEARAVARARGYRSMLAVPMLHRGVGIGSISVSRQEKGPFRDHHIALLETFADQAVIAIENVWLFKALQSRTSALTKSEHQLKALSEVGRAVSSTLDLEKVLQTIVQSAVRLTGLDGGAIYEYDERAEEFRLRAAHQLAPELLEALRRVPIRKGDGTVGGTAVTLEAAQVPDILFDIYQSSRKERMIEVGFRAVLTVPLLREDRVIGALSVSRRAPGPFDPEVVELLRTFATHSSIAIQKARLVHEIAEQEKLLEVARRRDA